MTWRCVFIFLYLFVSKDDIHYIDSHEIIQCGVYSD